MTKTDCSENKKRFGLAGTLIVLALLLAGGIVLAVCIGKYPVSPQESLRVIWGSFFGQDPSTSEMTINVVLKLRIPRILASVLVGAALSMSGAVYQGIFKNPLVSPDFLGVSNGACIGAAVAILLSLTSVYVSIFAFLGGLVAVGITMSIPVMIRNKSNIMLVLAGIIVGSVLSSGLGFIKYLADPDTQLASITYWTMGSFSYITIKELAVVTPILIAPMVILAVISWWIDVLSMGEDDAKALGANVGLVRTIAILCSTLLTAGSVCMAGTIGWVGLIVPHLGRMLIGPSNRKLIPTSAFIGGLFMLTVDTLTRIIGASEMPVSIMTGAIGAPFFCWLLWKQKRA